MKDKGNDKLKNNKSALPVLALFFAFLFPPAGFILSIIALNKTNNKTGMSVTAIVFSVLVGLAVLIIFGPIILL